MNIMMDNNKRFLHSAEMSFIFQQTGVLTNVFHFHQVVSKQDVFLKCHWLVLSKGFPESAFINSEMTELLVKKFEGGGFHHPS